MPEPGRQDTMPVSPRKDSSNSVSRALSDDEHDGSNGRILISETPFVVGMNGLPEYEQVPGDTQWIEPQTLKVKRVQALWSDLLLDVAMTTTFSSLTDGTEVTGPLSALSYIVYFAMVWWIWASQVAYNVRFRTPDWTHRIFVFLQFLVFCALAAFTREFDIASGIRHDKDEGRIVQIQRAESFTDDDINVSAARAELLNRLNSKGISITMGLSRLWLLVQYARVLYYARGVERRALLLQCVFLLASSIAYFVAVAFVRDPKVYNIVKIILWCLPLVTEVISHYAADKLPGRTEYPVEAMSERAKTVFIIILGGGLDKITEGFRFIAGNVSLGSKGTGLIFCAAVIFITQFSTYFGMREDPNPSNRRVLSWFFAHFLYLSMLILTLHGVAALLHFGNINKAMEIPISMVGQLNDVYSSNPGQGLEPSDLQFLNQSLQKYDIALSSLVEGINIFIENPDLYKDTNVTMDTVVSNDILWWSVYAIVIALTNLGVSPDPNSLVGSQITAFLFADSWDTSLVNRTSYGEIITGIINDLNEPAKWFFAVAGLTFVTLTTIGLLVRWPKDRYEMWVSGSRLVFGLIVVALSALNIGQTNIEINGDEQHPVISLQRRSRPWPGRTNLPILAVLLIIEQGIELVAMIFLPGKSQAPIQAPILSEEHNSSIPSMRKHTADIQTPTYSSEPFTDVKANELHATV